MSAAFEHAVLEKPGKPLYIALADYIESLIESHELKHNEKLPTTAELAKRLGVTISTVQQGLARLTEKGLLKRAPKLGTFVNAAKESRCVAVTFGFNPFEQDSRFYALFYKGLQDALRERGLSFASHLEGHEEAFAPWLRRFASEIDEGQYACVLPLEFSRGFIEWLEAQDKTPFFHQVAPDLKQSVFEGFGQLLDRGYRKIEFVSMYNDYNDWILEKELEGIKDAYASRGLKPLPEKSIFKWGYLTNGAYEKAKSLFGKRPRREWPEAIFSHHDVLTKGLLIAFAELGIRIPEDIALLTHSNKGDSFPCAVPLARMEADPEKIAIATAKRIDLGLGGALQAGADAEPVKSVFIDGRSLPTLKH